MAPVSKEGNEGVKGSDELEWKAGCRKETDTLM
jgi:hypothetical protein